jgi:hypothetical protein
MCTLELLEERLRSAFIKVFPTIQTVAVRYGDETGMKFSYITIPPENVNLKGSDYYLDEELEFYHFTSINALQSIVSNKSIRLYNLNHLDDPREFKYAGNLIPLDEKRNTDAKENFFILSLCRNIREMQIPDKFNMWRLYGDNGNGCIIKLSLSDNPPSNWHNFYLSNVQYGIDRKSHIYELREALKKLNKNNQQIGIDLGQLMCFHKSELYEHENEVRLLYDKRGTTVYGHTTLYDKDNCILFPIVRKQLQANFNRNVQYLELPISRVMKDLIDERIPILRIGEVILGYRLKEHFEDIKQEIQSLFEYFLGYAPSIQLSSLTKRYWGK